MTVHKFLNTELTNEQYHGDTSALTNSPYRHLSSSGMKKLIESPQAYREIYIDGFSSGGTEAMDTGSYTHALILEPHLVEKEFAVYTGGIRRGKDWDAFRDEHKHKTIITEKQKQQADNMVAAFHKSKHAPQLIKPGEGKPEVSFLGDFDGVPVKCRTDFLRDVHFPGDPNPGGAIVDIKTTSSQLTDDEIAATIFKYSYELSTALYLDILEQYDGVKRSFYFVYLSKYGEGGCRVWRASDKLLELGRIKYRRALDVYRDCLLYGFDERGESDTIPEITPPLHLYGTSFGK